MPREYFGKPTLHVFENTDIFIPERCDEFLTTIYGNWRRMPPKDKQVSEHDYIYFDLHKSFLE